MEQPDSPPSIKILPDGSVKTPFFDLRDMKWNLGVQQMQDAVSAMGEFISQSLATMGIPATVQWEVFDFEESCADGTGGWFVVSRKPEQPDPIKSALEACILAIEFYMTSPGEDDEKIARCHERMLNASLKGRDVLRNLDPTSTPADES